MIAAIEWIPAGRANPNPSKYEYSRAEQEFLEKVQAGELTTENDDDDEDWEDVDDDEEEQEEQGEEVEVPKVDPESLPKDLRMDDYSDDDEEDGEKNIGGLLVGKVRCFLLSLSLMCMCTYYSILPRGYWMSNMFCLYNLLFIYLPDDSHHCHSSIAHLVMHKNCIYHHIDAFPFFGIPVV